MNNFIYKKSPINNRKNFQDPASQWKLGITALKINIRFMSSTGNPGEGREGREGKEGEGSAELNENINYPTQENDPYGWEIDNNFVRYIPFEETNSMDGETTASDRVDVKDMELFRYAQENQDMEKERDWHEHNARIQGKPPQRGCSRPFEDEPAMSGPSPKDSIPPMENLTAEVSDPYTLNVERYNASPSTVFEEEPLPPRIYTREEVAENLARFFNSTNTNLPAQDISPYPDPNSE